MAENPETVITSSVMIPLTRAGKPRGSKNYSTLFKETRASNLAVIRVAVEKRKAMKEDERRAKNGPPLRRGGPSLARLSSLGPKVCLLIGKVPQRLNRALSSHDMQ